MAFAVGVYFLLMSQSLVNSLDGVWHTSNFVAGDWEISLGRGVLRYLDKLYFGVVSVPLNSILTLLLFSVSNALILDLFSLKGAQGLVMSLFLIASPVVCITLSHNYMTVGFGMSCFLSVLAVCAVHFIDNYKGVLLGGVCLAFSMGCYQAYLSVTCILLLMLILKDLLENQDAKTVLASVVRKALMLLFGGGCYYALVQALLLRAGISMASYKGASGVSLFGIIFGLPQSIAHCYQYFYDYFVQRKMYALSSVALIFLAGMGIVILYSVIRQGICLFRKNKTYGILFLAASMLVPVASNAVVLIATGNQVTLLMAMGMNLELFSL